jgi:putative FmdB family regulatory protein
MPMYDYRCEACGHRFEKMVKLDAPAPACPECGADASKKLVSPVAFQLKGGGWYKDHYGLKSSSSSSSSGDGGSSSGGASSAGGGDA